MLDPIERNTIISTSENPFTKIYAYPKAIYGKSLKRNFHITKNTLLLIVKQQICSTLYGLIISNTSLSALHSSNMEPSMY